MGVRSGGGSEINDLGVNQDRGLPEIVYVPDLARLLQITPKAVRQRAARGQVPAPFRLGKALAWTREAVLIWLRDCVRSTRPGDMKITLRPYAHDKTRWHVDIRLMNPCDTEKEIRRRMVAPAGLSEAQARAWGERQVPALLRGVMGEAAVNDTSRDKEITNAQTKKTTRITPSAASSTNARAMPSVAPRRSEMTLVELFRERFEPEHVYLQKVGTQQSYDVTFRLHILPRLGDLPLAVIDEDRLSSFRAALRQRLGVRSVNLVLTHLAKALRFAQKIKVLETRPLIEKLPTPRRRPKEVYSSEEIEALLKTAESMDTTRELICLLALDAGLRVSEICALEWRDVDLAAGTLIIQHNVFEGHSQTPKGTIGRVAMTSALRDALERHRRHESIGPLVLYRRNPRGDNPWRPFTRGSISQLLKRLQAKAGIRTSGPHLLRHTALTRLSDLGASVYVIQAVARHSDLQTTQAYLHTQQGARTIEAAQLLDRAARGRSLAKQEESRGTEL
jgi:integrase/predicted DNA-binding transcriptional regulator AlpA